MIERNDGSLDVETVDPLDFSEPKEIATWKLCECGKRGYSSHAQAIEANHTAGNRLRIYRCHKNKWVLHVTNQDKESYQHHYDRTKQRTKYKRAINKWSTKGDE